MDGSSPPISLLSDLYPSLSELGSRRHTRTYSARPGSRFGVARQNRCLRMFRRWHLRIGKKRGLLVGKTKRSKGTKIMAIAAGHSLPVAVCVICIASASPHGVTLVKELLKDRCLGRRPKRLIGDKAYDSHALDELLWAWLHNFRRLVVPWDRTPGNFLGFIYLGCILILLRRL